MLILSPSKGQDFDHPAPTDRYSTPDFLEHSLELIKLLRDYSCAELRELMQISEKIALLNQQRYADFSLPFSPGNAKQALYAFSGDVYRPLERADYSVADLDFAQTQLRILSGLYGCLRPLDLIQPYRLEMKTRLANGRGRNLYAFWGRRVAEAINQAGRATDARVLFNLASNEYSRVIPKKELELPMVDILFQEQQGDQLKTISVYAKRARGLMADYIIRNRITTLKGVEGFSAEGYSFAPTLSSPARYLFTRPKP
ncbi:peroxide stress protein YaaA [Desulfogranum mediterraneum]|uniref:peroxide stress protein YaaA n=1 Tax=Desulfogranum mediterraneum TaxID=160661 RepID=UPI0003F4CE8A|nr:peroxide stress protein YaaA [Desulfogranum mediterraneum]